MPTYDYKCKNCGNAFELFQKMSDEPVKICPKCGGEVKRLIGAGSGPIFKGTGFYQTDYKNSSKPGGGNSSKVSSETSAAPAVKETKTETKSPEKS